MKTTQEYAITPSSEKEAQHLLDLGYRYTTGGYYIKRTHKTLPTITYAEAKELGVFKKKADDEKIISAAINLHGVIIVGKRHGNCYASLQGIYAEPGDVPNGVITSGFWTDKFRYIDRKEAFKLAKTNGQLAEKEWNRKDQDLYSEDLR